MVGRAEMKELEYPFDSKELIKYKRKFRRLLLENGKKFLEKRIAILGGSTTRGIREILELFLLNYGIRPEFYESEYNQYYAESMFPNKELESFHPDIIFIHTTNRNIEVYPGTADSREEVEENRRREFSRFCGMWDRLREVYKCPIIQNNFELPHYRLMGNRASSDYRGRVNYISRLNLDFYDYAEQHQNFYINDLNYLSAEYGLKAWADPYYWEMYKYAVAVPAIPYLAFSVANIIKSIFGFNKKGLVLDCDNTLWGGIVGDIGADNIDIGQENALAETYTEFQEYLKSLRELGFILTVNSKNDEENALSGFARPDSVLKREDFAVFKSNWESKDRNFVEIAQILNVMPESLVFVDDNPAEREIVRQSVEGDIAAPEISEPEHYIELVDRAGYFEITSLTDDDLKRGEMYRENAQRRQAQSTFADYSEYLKSLNMKGSIKPFEPAYMARIAQLTNKSNQFNLTTKRYTQDEIEQVAEDKVHITLYGKLEDKFGDNGVVSVVIGKIAGKNADELHIELWLMSCRVLKRDMEFAMMDNLVMKAREMKIQRLVGYYYPTAKNGMVQEFYSVQGFNKVSEDEKGNTVWEYLIPEVYQRRNTVIEVCDA